MAINASLQHLGFVIRQLTKGKTKDQIDYDQHVLTAAMKDSLGGNAKTLMIVNISPSDYNIVQTRESLEFAKLTGKIVNQPGLLIADIPAARDNDLDIAKQAKTLRETQRYGWDDRTDFYYPKKEDIEALSGGQPVKAVSFDYWTRKTPGGITYLNKLQVHYSNGKSSPMFAGKKPSDSAKKTVHLGDVANIRQIQGTEEGWSIGQLIFKRENGDEVGRIDTGEKANPLSDVVTRLADGEELIGFAGQ